MILSPLEQFNILSLFDFTFLVNFEILYAVFLNWIWFIFYYYPINFIFNFINFYNLGYISYYFIIIFFIPTIKLLSLFFTFLVSILITLNIDKLYIFIDILYNVYNLSLSFIWYLCYNNLNIFYFFNNILFLPLNLIISNTNIQTNLIINIPFLIETNINLLCSNIGIYIINLYFIILEIYLFIKILLYKLIVINILNLSLCNLSYLIFSLNTSTIFQILGISLISLLFLTTTWKNTITFISKNYWQTLLEMFYQIILGVVNENAGIQGIKFYPLIFTTFVIILTCNVLGMIPYSFTVTSHLIITFSTALAIFIGINILGIIKHGKHFLSLFFPPGAPLILAPLLVLIEFISYVFRVLSLSIRLFANLMSGHTLLKILATFSWSVVSLWGIYLLPITIILIVTGLEMAIAFLQAYIFSVLLCIYLNDAFNLH